MSQYYPDFCNEEIKRLAIEFTAAKIKILEEQLVLLEGVTNAQEFSDVDANITAQITKLRIKYSYAVEEYLSRNKHSDNDLLLTKLLEVVQSKS